MTDAKILTINLQEEFPHLPGAPIAEAIIDIRAKAEAQWEESSARASLGPLLEGYNFLDSQQESQIKLKVQAGLPVQQVVQQGWKGIRFRSIDEKNVAEFNRSGFVFRRLPPYEDWSHLMSEAFRLWSMYLNLAKPTQVQRLGLRFINRIELVPPDLNIEEYISGGPLSPKGLNLPFHNFMHHDTWAVPGHSYAMNVIRVFQSQPGNPLAVILDIDVYTLPSFELEEGLLERHLAEMRWLKNKAFFGIVTDKLLDKFKQPL
jgi:uncharacterized protein (TIGR04255 family)